MNVTASGRIVRKWVLVCSVLGIGWLGVFPANAAKILYVVDSVLADGTANNANDREVVGKLTSQGHTITIADDQDAALDTFLPGQDLIIISSSVGSGNEPLHTLALDPLKTGTTPIISCEPGLYDELGFQIVNTFGNAAGHTLLAMTAVNQSHPLAAGKVGNVTMVTSGNAVFSSSGLPVEVGADAIVIAANGTPGVDVGRLAIWAYDIDDRLVDNTTTVPSRRVAFFFNATTGVGIYNTNAYDLYYAAVNWALAIGATNEPPRIKNLTPANDAAFVALNQGISFSVKTISPNSIPTANIRLVLNGTDVSSALTIGGTSSNRTVNWPGPLTENTLYNGQITASDNNGRSTTVAWTFDTVGTVRPRPNAFGVNPATDIFMELVDQNRQVNTNGIVLSFNGNTVSATVSKTGTRTAISYDPPGLLPSNSTNVATLVFSDTLGTSHTNSWNFVVLNYAALPTLPPEFKAPAGTVDLNRKGFLLKLRQMEVARPGGGNVDSVRRQLDDLYIDPGTMAPYQDLIDRTQAGTEPGSGFNADGTFTDVGVINYNQAAALGTSVGNFTAANGYTDKPIPGIPGLSGTDDNVAMQAVTYLDLKVGVYQLAVRSDDGFRVSCGPGPQDAFSLILGEVNADRGAANSPFSFVVQEDGYYSFELIYWDSTGGAELEFYSIDPITSANVLLNGTNSNAIQAYRPASITPPRPIVRSVNPARGATGVPRSSTIGADLVDGAALVNTNSIRLLVNGAAVGPSITKIGAVTTINYDPPGDLVNLSSNGVVLIFADNGSPVITRTNAWSFTVESALPKAILVVSNPAAPTASETALRNRLQSTLGFEASFVADASAVPTYANFASLILVSSTVGSGNITKYRDVTAPIIDWEWAAYDGLALATGDGASIDNTQTQIQIVNASHPLAAGIPAGAVTLFPAPATQMASVETNLLAPSAIVVALAADPLFNTRAVLFGFEKNAVLNPDPISGSPVTAPARRTGIFLGGDTFTALNADGLKLFDAAVNWTANLVGTAVPIFNPPVLSGGSVSLSWTGAGVLQVATNLTGTAADWSTVSPQPTNNTFNAQVGASPRSFYRIRQ